MSKVRAQLEEDRAMRNAAKRLVANGLHNIRGDVQEQGVAKRAATRMREGAEGLVDDTTTFARENPGRIGSGVGLGVSLLAAWLFRDEISQLVEKHWHHIEDFAGQITGGDETTEE